MICSVVPKVMLSVHGIAMLSCFIIGLPLHNVFAQPVNDRCAMATDVSSALDDYIFTCIEGTLDGATPDALTDEGCDLSAFRTVWYRFEVNDYKLVNIHVRSEQLETPILRLFSASGSGCNVLTSLLVEETPYHFSYCITGVDGKAEIIARPFEPGSTYYLAVSTLDTGPGAFELCINGLDDYYPCIVITSVNVTSRSNGGPLSGPFFKGETLNFQVEVWDHTELSQSCDFFQGLIPVLGTSWDNRFYDHLNPPENATLNNQSFDGYVEGRYSGFWQWHSDDVNYHLWNEHLKYGLFPDALTYPALKNALYEPNIPEYAEYVNPGCCDPCWTSGGTILPPGWFCIGGFTRCELNGRVRYAYGDAINCSTNIRGPWTFTFNLQVTDYIPNCTTGGDLELYLSLFPFTDAAVGAWIPSTTCMDDPYAFKRLPVACNDASGTIPIISKSLPNCPGDSIRIALDSLIPPEFGVTYWSYEFDQPNDQYPLSGYLLPGSELVFTASTISSSGGAVRVWLQAFKSARELIGRVRYHMYNQTPPTAGFTWNIVGDQVRFTAPAANIDSYTWHFGDGDSSVVRSPVHSYEKEGLYHVQLIVSNSCGMDTIDQDIFFIYQAPEANFTFSDTVICLNDSIQFAVDFGGLIDSLQWTFDGGLPATSSDSAVTVVYAEPGIYDVGLTLFNPLGSDTGMETNLVTVLEHVLLDYKVIVLDSLVGFVFKGMGADSSWWRIDTFGVFSGDTVSFQFPQAGLYPITLYASNICGVDSLIFNFELLTTGLSNPHADDGIYIYPNPTSGLIYIDFATNENWLSLSLQDIRGNVLWSEVNSAMSIPLELDMQSLFIPDGLYVLSITFETGTVHRKVVFTKP